jgi:hypothetical protein
METAGIGGLIGNTAVAPEFKIHNKSDRVFILERAELVTGNGRQSATLPAGGAIEARTIRPGAADAIALLWKFPLGAPDALGANPRIVLWIRVGEDRRQLAITYERIR